MRPQCVEHIAAGLGILGALLLAVGAPPALGFAAFLGSNLAGVAFMARHGHRRLLVQQGIFLVTSLIGLWTWWLAPLLGA